MKLKILGLLFICLLSTTTSNAQEPMLGEVKIFAGNFPPRGYAFCEGQLLSISQNSALFSLLGTMYGGDGRTTFGLPDLRGRVAISAGRYPGSLYNHRQGSKGGQEVHALTITEMPSHSHFIDPTTVKVASTVSIPVNTGLADTNNPEEADLAESTAGNMYSTSGNTDATLKPFSAPGVLTGLSGTLNTGGNRQFNIIQPYVTIRYIIALQGIFPSRS